MIMGGKKSKILIALLVITLIILTVVAAIRLGPSWTFFVIFGAIIFTICSIFVSWLIIKSCTTTTAPVRSMTQVDEESQDSELQSTCTFFRKVAGVPAKFPYKELEKATDNFTSMIGRGASGSVFKGILNDGTYVAVKRIENSTHGGKEFRSEVAAIACVQHINLVRLFGYCTVPSGPRFLVYEYIQNGSLDGWIFPRRDTRNRRGGCLSWKLRYQVAIDVAKALSYLHRDCRSTILHLDVKPENILLDESFRAVVSDFGVSKLMDRDQSKVVTTMRGTRGYLAPEWILQNGISEKSDVFSYGMVLLEMIGGRRNICQLSGKSDEESNTTKWEYFPKIVVDKVKEGKLMEVVDKRLMMVNGAPHIDGNELKRLTYVALWCIQEKPRHRPIMTHVVQMLEGRSPVDEPPETEMMMVDMLQIGPRRNKDRHHRTPRVPGLSTSESATSSTSTSSSSVNSLETMTVLTGR